MAYVVRYTIDSGPEMSRRGVAGVDRVLSGLRSLVDAGLIEPAEYRNAAARWLRLKADLLRQLGKDDFAVGIEELIVSQFADPVFQPPAPYPSEVDRG